MKTFLLALITGLSLTACQSSSKSQVPANVPPEETAAPTADTTSQVK